MTPHRPGLRSLLALAALATPAVASAQVPAQVGGRAIERAGVIEPQVITTTPVQAPGAVVGTPVPARATTVVGTLTGVAPPTIGSHQIDRFAAIRQLQADLKSDANNVINWTILGELAHEVALDLPEGQDDAYYTMSRDAYEHAAALDPTNNGLKAALQFAREQETGAAAFDAQRRQGVATYLDARRREMSATGVNPTVMVYETPGTMGTPVAPGTTVVNGPVTTSTAYPTPNYRPYYNAQANQPYSYNQYSNGYLPPRLPAGNNASGVATPAPTTLRQYGQQLPGVLINQGVRTIGGAVVPR